MLHQLYCGGMARAKLVYR